MDVDKNKKNKVLQLYFFLIFILRGYVPYCYYYLQVQHSAIFVCLLLTGF